jgi:NSS family neurotransmitter:Na+ symporter
LERWSSRLVFVLAAIGSAVGIGNIWRFPMVVGQNGGGAYLIPYFLAVVCLAVPLMILEMAVGRHWRRNLVSSFELAGKKHMILGWLICLIVLLILSYYLVIMGWTLAYLVFSLLGSDVTFSSFSSSLQPVVYFLISVLATGVIVSLGVNMGIERIVSVMIPFAFLILVALVLFSISLPGFRPGMDFFLRPDYSILGCPDVWSAAIGQAFFSLSVGMGILITYGAYLEDDMDIPQSALIITISDLLAAMLAGIAIFSLVFTFGLEPTAGAELAFTTLPRAFELMPYGRIFSVLFFALLFSAALTSSISMMEMNVAAIMGQTKSSRKRASILLMILLVALGTPSALSYSSLDLRFFGSRILDLMDVSVGTIGLPIAALLVAITFRWFVDDDVLAGQTNLSGRWLWLLSALTKYVIPIALLAITVAMFMDI